MTVVWSAILAAYALFAVMNAATTSHLPAISAIGAAIAVRPLLPNIGLDDLLRKLAGLPETSASQRARRAEFLIRALALLAGALAGRKHYHLREAWAADLYGDPKISGLSPARRRIRLTTGFVIAALRCRTDDALMLAWRPVDALLASWHGSQMGITIPVTVATGMGSLHIRASTA